jgi:antitoxin component YwqK of YwqJK toxin-antitoxin module
VKFYFFLIIGILSLLNSYAQVSKIYVTSEGKYSVDPKNAVSYNLIEKIDDSAYRVRNYNMKDTIIYQGIYKDELLTIPNGRFIYYTKKTIPSNLEGVLHTDTNNFISEVGYFSNGIKTGMWTEFEKQGIKRCTYIYKGDKLNGLYQRYETHHNYVMEEGNYIDGLKDGEWNLYGYDTLKTPIKTRIYKDDKLLQEIIHLNSAHFQQNPGNYLMQKFKSLDTVKIKLVKTEITIDVNGQVENPQILSPLPSLAIRDIIIDALAGMPKFIPQMRDGKPEKTKYFLEFSNQYSSKSVGHRLFLTLKKDLGNGMSFGDPPIIID